MADTSTYTLLQRISVTASVSSVTFSNIPQTGYTDLRVVASTRNTASNTLGLLNIRFNGSSSNLSSIVMYGFGSNQGTSGYSGVNYAIWGYTNGSTSTSNVFANTEFTIPNYTSSNYKSVSVDSVNEHNATDGRQSLTAGLWSDTSAITSITLDALDGGAGGQNFVTGCTFSLYATSALGTTPGTPKALGGDIVKTDGTYWYHSFLNTGQFIPQSALSCDYVVVAGGGAGGNADMNNVAGGGGAGGFRTSIGGSALSLSATSYPVIIGAGGAPGEDGQNGGNGSTSTFATINASGGGGGGGSPAASGTQPGSNGGSGGGGGDTLSGNQVGGSGNSGSYSPVEGYAGGNCAASSAGGGGGAGGAGSAGSGASSYTGGTGGIGTYNAITDAVAIGQLSSSHYYLAGGGGGGAESTGGTAGIGGGGTGGQVSGGIGRIGVRGLPNSGGGGGGARSETSTSGPNNGGSGIVIIRYAV